jgi:NTE family protein
MPQQPVTIALQGGGTHGAFAWGALDRLLEDDRLRIDAITATSGGAMNAVILADGYIRDGAEGARKHLHAFWKKVSVAAGMLPVRIGVMDRMLSDIGIDFSPSTMAMDYLTRLFSPYQLNVFDLNPLRAIVEEMVDFPALRTADFALYINATHVPTGKSRVFTGKELSLDVVMASACLPFLFRTVNIRDEPFWDGGYSGNPALHPLLGERAQSRDILLIQTAALLSDDVPTRAADILDRATEISFGNALTQEIRALHDHNRSWPDRALRLHLVESNELLGPLGRASKLNADWDFLTYLHDLGAQAMNDWLERGATQIGKASTVDIERVFL